MVPAVGIGSLRVREAHPNNPTVRLGPNGVWGEDILPVTVWEAPEHRVVLPEVSQRKWGVEEPLLRVAQDKRDRMLTEHDTDQDVIERIQELLPAAYLAGPDPRPGRKEYLALIRYEEKVYRVVAGRDRSGSLNLATVFGTDKPWEIRKWESWLSGLGRDERPFPGWPHRGLLTRRGRPSPPKRPTHLHPQVYPEGQPGSASTAADEQAGCVVDRVATSVSDSAIRTRDDCAHHARRLSSSLRSSS